MKIKFLRKEFYSNSDLLWVLIDNSTYPVSYKTLLWLLMRQSQATNRLSSLPISPPFSIDIRIRILFPKSCWLIYNLIFWDKLRFILEAWLSKRRLLRLIRSKRRDQKLKLMKIKKRKMKRSKMITKRKIKKRMKVRVRVMKRQKKIKKIVKIKVTKRMLKLLIKIKKKNPNQKKKSLKNMKSKNNEKLQELIRIDLFLQKAITLKIFLKKKMNFRNASLWLRPWKE